MHPNRKPKFFTLKKYNKFNNIGGTVNRVEMKSCFLQVKGQMTCLAEDHNRELKLFLYRIKQCVHKVIRTSKFKSKYIMDQQIKESYKWKKDGFYTIEFNFFVGDNMKIEEVIETFNKITGLLDHEVYGRLDQFIFEPHTPYQTKKLSESKNNQSI